MGSGRVIPGPYTQEARQHWLTQLLRAQTWIRHNGPPGVRGIELINLEELQEIRRIWVVDKHELEDALPRLYREATGEDYPGRPLDDYQTLGERDMRELEELSEGDRLHDENIARLESERDRVPAADQIAVIQRELEAARSAHEAKLAELEAVRARKQSLKRQWDMAEARLDKLGEQDLNARFAEDDRQRFLKHSARVRETLGRFRTRVVRRHTASMEALMLECFSQLLRKTHLVTGLTIDPETFEATLAGRDGQRLPFDRLSAGERQLLATALLWGLARASGRPVPTIIDTPLGRLDSSHRRHLIERYFPNASHQVLLLSTDEEIVGSYYEALQPFISRSYLLAHNDERGMTNLEPGYFAKKCRHSGK
jgi:DNA sulfur modification protein DndD